MVLSKRKIYLAFSGFWILFLLVNINHIACKNPHDYEPQFDSLYPPPVPPQLISPVNDTVIVYYEPYPHDIVLEWNPIVEAEYYQLQIVNDSTQFLEAPVIKIESTSMVNTLIHKGFYYWHVRAYNHEWTWFTDWSETWHFYTWYCPNM